MEQVPRIPGQASKRRLPPAIRKAIEGEIKEPQLAELSAHFFHAAGGPKAVAKMLFDEFAHANPGSQIRQRILDMILRVTRFANQQSGPVDDLGILTDEDLEREVVRVLDQFPKEITEP